MPVYEYYCLDCHQRFELSLAYEDYDNKKVSCIHCNSNNVQRRIGPIRVARSDESRMESLADPSKLAGLEDDPRSLGRMMRQMSSEIGEDMGPEFDEVINRLESGQNPEQIEKDLPDLGMGDTEGGFGGGSEYPDSPGL